VATIRTTHAGSLPRPTELVELFAQMSRGATVDRSQLDDLVDAAVADVVTRQHDAGIDIANDGEQSRESFFTYVQHRMSGFGPGDGRARFWQDFADFPEFVEQAKTRRPATAAVNLARPAQAIGPIAYSSTDEIDADIDRFERIARRAGFGDLFMTAPSPGIVVTAMADQHYGDRSEYLAAVGDALAVEYRRIVEAGYLLQIDAPDLAMERHGLFAADSTAEFLEFVADVIATINRGVDGLPPERVRLHVCWGNYDGPHTHDIPLTDLIELLYSADVGGLLLSGANPRHAHEYRVFEDHPLPAGWELCAGVVDTTTNYVEHPEVIAERLERYAAVVGDPGRIIASTDCGFDTSAGFRAVASDVAWAKLAAMREGSDLAASRLF